MLALAQTPLVAAQVPQGSQATDRITVPGVSTELLSLVYTFMESLFLTPATLWHPLEAKVWYLWQI